ncbi:amino acid adenylation domain-containing protein [Paenibacillus melissococcoides]|uniref:Amino acid adenylation domain-containing protein n=1 Tax=Paenibacillus melissococcoides TaxID=2912268 RepID=A0ABM9G3R8_9BACL|nr:amino acid adenylation domain-containing protein [Paenibacillus melissococcoides]MEB9895619.1 amino acid adenylation domain-containing protein [Bacillus cereus]CAH8246372.1 amino acid adenylation domain-containing protein [Paenibacillus melissococcoides]CAH8714547.1 amino acid adenylation domain-containing protein [Paenibacillus melissococcoides]CAH8715503.1 amino acid adenylation domain-containing protein [Paenibacillus melissococcoides]
MSYSELDAWSDRLAALMSARGLGPDAAAGLLMPRSPELVACILAILKLGSAYVPLDLANSDDRLCFMIKDADLRLLCTREEYISRVPGDSPLLLDKEPGEGSGDLSAAGASAPSSQAYIMYTSGSTGKPKGCKISHQNVINLVFGQDFIDFGAHKVILQAASPAFDVSTFEIWGPLLHGGTLVLPGEGDLLDAGRLKRLLAEEKVQSMVLTSSLFNRLCDRDPGTFGALSHLIVGGEALSVPHIAKAMNANPGLRLINGYGPAENSFLTTTHLIAPADLARERIPIGKPVGNSRVYIVDKGMNLLPAGAIGELCVSGDGVGMGYHERPEQTAQQFLQDRFVPGGRMYRTGDLAQWLPDGTIDYLGRLDTEVKVRGYRVELGEIERALMRLPGLRQAAVQFRQVGMERHVCAYYVSSGASRSGERKMERACAGPAAQRAGGSGCLHLRLCARH